MTIENKNYTVMELAEQVGVPRTTINDWLTKYSSYVSFTMQGKRRTYSERTLAMLKSVSELREKGASSFEIETELSKLYAIHGEPVLPGLEQTTAEGLKESADLPNTSSSDAEVVTQEEKFAILAKNNADLVSARFDEQFNSIMERMEKLDKSDEALKHFDGKFESMAARFDELDKAAREGRKSARTAYLLLALILCILGGGTFFAYQYIDALKAQANAKFKEFDAVKEESYTIYRTDMESLKDSVSNTAAGLNNGLADINKESRELKEALAKVEAGLPEQRKEFANLISDVKNAMESAVKQRDELMAQKEKTAKAELAAALKAKDIEIESLAKKLGDIEKMLEKERFARQQLEELRARETPSATPEKSSETPVNADSANASDNPVN